ncbi:hypothetical protein Hanom_Chr15g01409201 [Helianthus anomalus]
MKVGLLAFLDPKADFLPSESACSVATLFAGRLGCSASNECFAGSEVGPTSGPVFTCLLSSESKSGFCPEFIFPIWFLVSSVLSCWCFNAGDSVTWGEDTVVHLSNHFQAESSFDGLHLILICLVRGVDSSSFYSN